MNAPVLLSTINARYEHPALGLRYLAAQLDAAGIPNRIVEFSSKTPNEQIVEALAAHAPRILGIGVYIWNMTQFLELLPLLRARLPECVLVLGGPEVSHASEEHPLFPWADHVIEGEADHAFTGLCRTLTTSDIRPAKVLRAAPADPGTLRSPYSLYSENDLRTRFTYVEASRGCPFGCEFCLSSLEVPVRRFDAELFLRELRALYTRGARRFKFIDRTFNLNPQFSGRILEELLPLAREGAFFHFEIVPDRLAPGLLELASSYPEGTLQFEVGIQSFNPEVCSRIGRRQDFRATAENLRWLRANTSVHLHADLIAGLPGENLESFGSGFDRLWELNPQEIQVGILKKLRGAPIARHDADWEMRYSGIPPYEVQSTRTMNAGTLERLKRFARAFELYSNRARFPALLALLITASPFQQFLAFADWLAGRVKSLHQIPLDRQFALLAEYLICAEQADRAVVMQALESDYHSKPGRKPACLRAVIAEVEAAASRDQAAATPS